MPRVEVFRQGRCFILAANEALGLNVNVQRVLNQEIAAIHRVLLSDAG